MKIEVVSEKRVKYEVAVRTPADAYQVLERYRTRRREHFFALTLDGAHKITAVRIAAIGIVNRSLVHPREVFRRAITDNAAAIIVAHNHPSGSLEPSDEDHEVTRRLVEAGQLLGISVLDHLVISREGYFSFLEHSLI